MAEEVASRTDAVLAQVRALEAEVEKLRARAMLDPGMRHENCLNHHGLLLTFQEQMEDGGDDDDYLKSITDRVRKLERAVFSE